MLPEGSPPVVSVASEPQSEPHIDFAALDRMSPGPTAGQIKRNICLHSLQQTFENSQYLKQLFSSVRSVNAVSLPIIVFCEGEQKTALMPWLLLGSLALQAPLAVGAQIETSAHARDNTRPRYLRVAFAGMGTFIFTLQLTSSGIAIYFAEENDEPHKTVGNGIFAGLIIFSAGLASLRIAYDLGARCLQNTGMMVGLRSYSLASVLRPLFGFIAEPIIKMITSAGVNVWTYGSTAVIATGCGTVLAYFRSPKYSRNILLYDLLDAALTTAVVVRWVLPMFPSLAIGIPSVLFYQLIFMPFITERIARAITSSNLRAEVGLQQFQGALIEELSKSDAESAASAAPPVVTVDAKNADDGKVENPAVYSSGSNDDALPLRQQGGCCKGFFLSIYALFGGSKTAPMVTPAKPPDPQLLASRFVASSANK